METKARRRWHWHGCSSRQKHDDDGAGVGGCSSRCGPTVAGGAAVGNKYRRDERTTTMASAGTDVGEIVKKASSKTIVTTKMASAGGRLC